MKPNPNPRLTPLLAAIRRRWGPDALRPLRALGAPDAAIPTSFPALDRALGGGFPRGAVTELQGAPTSGMRTLALRTVISAQAAGDAAVWVDLEGTFDADYAARCGVDLNGLLLVRPDPVVTGVEIVRDIVSAGGAGVIVFDPVTALLAQPEGARALTDALRRLAAPLARAPCALVFLAARDAAGDAACSPDSTLSRHAALRLAVRREGWVWARRDIVGCRTQVTVRKSRFAPEGRSVSITIALDGVFDGDGV